MELLSNTFFSAYWSRIQEKNQIQNRVTLQNRITMENSLNPEGSIFLTELKMLWAGSTPCREGEREELSHNTGLGSSHWREPAYKPGARKETQAQRLDSSPGEEWEGPSLERVYPGSAFIDSHLRLQISDPPLWLLVLKQGLTLQLCHTLFDM